MHTLSYIQSRATYSSQNTRVL